MAGLISQLAPHQGKTSQELVTQKQTKFALEATNLKQPQPVKQLTPRACCLEVRQVKVAPERCGLLKSSLGEPLKGGALKARMNKLHRIRILI
jgi:hypothetical protein